MKSKCYGRSGTSEISKNCTDIPKRKVVAVVIDSYKRKFKFIPVKSFKIQNLN